MQKLSLVQSANYRWWASGAVALGTFASVVDISAMGLTLPSIADHFGTDLTTTQWVPIGYALTISALLLPMGRLSDTVGRKRVYIGGWLLFILGGAFAALAPSIMTLILAKILQGVGAAMTQGPAMAILVSAFPGSQRGRAFGIEITAVGTGAIVGPVLAGFLIGTLGWRSVFFSGILMGTLATIAALLILDGRHTRQPEDAPTFDWTGAALSTSALIAFLIGMTFGSRAGWVSPLIGAAMLSAAILVVTFVWWELRTPAPMMDVRLFKRKLFAMGVSANFISFLGNSPIHFLMPFYLQGILNYRPEQIGLIVVPGAVAMTVLGALSGRLSDRYGWRKFELAGLIAMVTGLFTLSTLGDTSSLGTILTGMVLVTGGSGIFYTANNSANLSAVEPNKYGVVAGFLNLTRNAASVTGTALTTAIVAAVMVSEGFPDTIAGVSTTDGAGVVQAFVSGLRVVFLAIGSLLLLALALVWVKGGARSTADEADPLVGSRELS